MPTVTYDLTYLDAGLAALENFLLAKDLQWSIGASAPAGAPPFPALTLESLLLAHRRLRGRSLPMTQQDQFSRLDRQLTDLRNRWRVAWESKAGHGFHARLVQWRNFLEDYREHPTENAPRYAYEVRLRVMVDLLAAELEPPLPAVLDVELLRSLDLILVARLVPGNFIWESDLQPAFPAGEFWYLYGALPVESK